MTDWVLSLEAKRRSDPGLQPLPRVSCWLKRNHMDLGKDGHAYFGCRQDRDPGLFRMHRPGLW